MAAYEAKDSCIGAHEGAPIVSKQADLSWRWRLRLLFLEKFFFYTPMRVGQLTSLAYTAQPKFFALEYTHGYEAYHILINREKLSSLGGSDGAWRQDLGHGLSCTGLRPWWIVTLPIFAYGQSLDATLWISVEEFGGFGIVMYLITYQWIITHLL